MSVLLVKVCTNSHESRDGYFSSFRLCSVIWIVPLKLEVISLWMFNFGESNVGNNYDKVGCEPHEPP